MFEEVAAGERFPIILQNFDKKHPLLCITINEIPMFPPRTMQYADQLEK